MARKTRTRPAPAAHFNPQPQDFLLAGIGAVSLGRKQLAKAYADGFQGIAGFRQRAKDVVEASAAAIDQKVIQISRKAGQWQKQAVALREEATQRLAPALSRLGVSVRKPVRAKRKPAARPAARRRKSA